LAVIVESLRLSGRVKSLEFGAGADKEQPYVAAASGLSLVDGEKEIARIGRVKTEVLLAMGIKQPVYFLECDLQKLNALPRSQKQFIPIPKYPMMKRDIALLVPEQVPAGELLKAVKGQRAELVESVDIFDVYSGKPIESGMKSVALSVTYRSPKKTLDDVTVDNIHKKIVQYLMTEFGGRYREGIK